MADPLDVKTIRATRNYSWREYALRVLWAGFKPLFRYSPRLLYGWRNLLLRLMGSRIGRGVRIYPSAEILFPWNFSIGDESTVSYGVFIYNLGPISIGRQVTVSHNVQLCAGTHDYNQPDFPLLKPPITIADGAWLCANSFIGPGVTVGTLAVVGACAVITRDAEPRSIYAGNPARKVGERRLQGT